MKNALKDIFIRWDSEVIPFIAKGNAIYFALINKNGEVIYCNKSMEFLRNDNYKERFINPNFDFILNLKEEHSFEGIITFGLMTSADNISINGRIIRKKDEILLIGELNINEIIEHNRIIKELNLENSNLNRLLIKEKRALLHTQKELIESKNKLVELNNVKDKFFSIIAHDLRGPVGNLKQMIELIYETFEDFDEEELLNIMKLLKNSSASVYELLENMLHWSRSQRNLITVKIAELDVNKLFEFVFKSLYSSAQNKNIELINLLNTDLVIRSDSFLLTTIIRNLISNSIKFTPNKGKIFVNCYLEYNFWVITVEDTGVGIPPTVIPELFRIDSRVTTIGTNKEKGSGLGLPLCKELIEKMHGTIQVTSELNYGSTFYVKIPLE